MPATYEPIATTTLGSSSLNIEFTSIPATYTDLRIVLTGTTTFNCTLGIQFNNDTGSNYSETRLEGDGSTASSGRNTNLTYLRWYSFNATTPTFHTIDIFSYAGSTNKTSLATSSTDLNGSGNVRRYAQLWRSTSAITSIKFGPGVSGASGTNFLTGTTATLFGIKAA